MALETLTASQAPNRVVSAVLNDPRPSVERPKRYLFDRPGLPAWTVVNDPRVMPIADARGSEAEALLARRHVIINVWRPTGHTVIDTPLALFDAASCTDDDLIMTDLVYQDRVGEIASVRHDPGHRRVFFSRMTPDEVVLIKCHDTARDGRRGCPSTPRSPTPPRRWTRRPGGVSKSAPSAFSRIDRAVRARGDR